MAKRWYFKDTSSYTTCDFADNPHDLSVTQGTPTTVTIDTSGYSSDSYICEFAINTGSFVPQNGLYHVRISVNACTNSEFKVGILYFAAGCGGAMYSSFFPSASYITSSGTYDLTIPVTTVVGTPVILDVVIYGKRTLNHGTREIIIDVNDPDSYVEEVTGRITAVQADITYTASASVSGRITAVQADVTYTQMTGRITAVQADVTYTPVSGRITAVQADITYDVVAGRITAVQADITYDPVTARITAVQADVTYDVKTARVTAVQADITYDVVTGRITAVQADVTYDPVSARITAVQADVTYDQVTGRITAVQADVTYDVVTGRITAVQADVTYDVVTGRITAVQADVTYDVKEARITAVQADVTYDVVSARITAVQADITYTPAGSVSGRITAVQADITYTPVSGRITAVQADVTYDVVAGRITAVQADITYDVITGRITAVQADVTYDVKAAKVTAVQADITYTVVSARITAVQADVTYTHPGTLEQNSFRARYDDGSESTANWQAAVNTDWSQDTGVNFRVRFLIKETTAGFVDNVTLKLQYNINSGGWNDVTAISSVVKAVDSIWFPPFATDTTQQLGVGTFLSDNDGCDHDYDGQVGGSVLDFVASEETEVEFSVQIIQADTSDGDTIQLRVVHSTGTALDNYAETPTITVNYPLIENLLLKLQASHNSGAYFDVTTTSSVIKMVDSTYIVDGTDTSQRIGSGVFVWDNDGIDEDGDVYDKPLHQQREFETEHALFIVDGDVSHADTIDLRLVENDAVGTLLQVYTEIPRITVDKSGAPAVYAFVLE